MRCAARLAAWVAACFIGAATAGELPVRNLGFESWNAEGKPEGWLVGSAAHRIAADCVAAPEGKCALRLQALPGTQDPFSSLAQWVPSELIGGHPVTLSGMIRTDNVSNGHASLWM